MATQNNNFKSFLVQALKDLIFSAVNEDSNVSGEEVTNNSIETHPEITKFTPIIPIVSSIPVINGQRITNLGDNWYYCRNIKATTFCNKEDFKKEVYPLAPNAPWNYVYRDKMKGLRGISLPNAIDRNLKCLVIDKRRGIVKEYSQVDVGPGYVDDPFWERGTNPKTESGIDHLGNKTALAGVDFFPQVWEDLGIMSFEDAYNGSPSGFFDLLIYDPSNVPVSKVKGLELPSKDGRQWVNELPDTGSEFFSWRELLKGYNKNERPPQSTINNLLLLTKEILHPVRVKFGTTNLGSCLRDPETNARVGGREGSFHLTGRAADVSPANASFKDVYEWVQNNISKELLRECVWEFPGTSNEHVHVAVKLDPNENRNVRIKK